MLWGTGLWGSGARVSILAFPVPVLLALSLIGMLGFRTRKDVSLFLHTYRERKDPLGMLRTLTARHLIFDLSRLGPLSPVLSPRRFPQWRLLQIPGCMGFEIYRLDLANNKRVKG